MIIVERLPPALCSLWRHSRPVSCQLQIGDKLRSAQEQQKLQLRRKLPGPTESPRRTASAQVPTSIIHKVYATLRFS